MWIPWLLTKHTEFIKNDFYSWALYSGVFSITVFHFKVTSLWTPSGNPDVLVSLQKTHARVQFPLPILENHILFLTFYYWLSTLYIIVLLE